MQDAAAVGGEQGDDVAFLGFNVAGDLPHRFDAGDRSELRPTGFQAQQLESVQFVGSGATTRLGSAEALIQGLVQRNRSPLMHWRVQVREEAATNWGVVLRRQYVVTTARGDLLGNGRLTAHSIHRNDGAFERQQRQQVFDRRDLRSISLRKCVGAQRWPVLRLVDRHLYQLGLSAHGFVSQAASQWHKPDGPRGAT